MLTRRELLAAGGLALAGGFLPVPAASSRGRDEVVIAMRSAGQGARVWFEPAGILVRPGTLVRWIAGEGVHTTTAYHPEVADRPRRIPGRARPWDSGYLEPSDAAFETTLEAEGVHDYFCRPHEAAGMVGRIVVTSAPQPDLDAPRFRPRDESGLPPGARGAFPSVGEIVREGRVAGRPAG